MVELTTGEKIARDLCEMDVPSGDVLEVNPADVARRIDEAVLERTKQLQARVAELEAEVERLIGCLLHLHRMSATEACIEIPSVGDYVEQMEKQFISAQAEIKRLRDALQTYIDEHEECQDADDWMAMMCSMEAHHVADEALAQPSDISALDAYVAEKVKEATTGHVEDIRFKNKEIDDLRRIKMSRFNNEDCWIYQGDGEDHLESLSCPVVVYPSVLIELTRQRDLAVEAASDAATSLETIQLRSFGEESYLDSKPQMRAFAGARAKIARDALSTIKESEVADGT